jgi:two-component system phosphate regulon sensor histidine kinase PhoR
MDQLVRQLLDLRQIESGSPLNIQPVSLAKILVAIVMEYELPSQQKNLTLMLDFPSKNPLMIEADPLRIEQVFANLVSNAIKYTPEGGKVVIRVPVADEEAVTVEIEDNGLGIPEDALPKLFQRFFRVDTIAHRQAASGTGLGLAIVRGIIESHHGTIAVESEINRGSIFTVKLPRTQQG